MNELFIGRFEDVYDNCLLFNCYNIKEGTDIKLSWAGYEEIRMSIYHMVVVNDIVEHQNRGKVNEIAFGAAKNTDGDPDRDGGKEYD
jgi:hypothetical protein